MITKKMSSRTLRHFGIPSLPYDCARALSRLRGMQESKLPMDWTNLTISELGIHISEEISTSINNVDSYAKCMHSKDTLHQVGVRWP